MKRAALALCALLGACALSPYDTSWPDPRRSPEPGSTRTADSAVPVGPNGGDIGGCARNAEVRKNGRCVSPARAADDLARRQ